MMYMSRPFRVSARKGLQLVEQLKTARGICKSRGELEGAEPASSWIKCPENPCNARVEVSEARIFVLLRSTKIWHYTGCQKSPNGLF